MVDLDKSGYGFQRVRTYLGPSLGWTDELVQPTTTITTGGVYNVQAGDSLLLVDVAASVVINLPDVIKWIQQSANQPATGFERSITIKDLGGNASSFNIVVVPFGQQALDNIQGSVVISQDRAAIKLVPLIDLSGWAVALASVSGGGSGGGDVFKAGNNTFTGTNDFTGTTTAVTEVSTDNTGKVATTAFVKAQGYLISSALGPYALIASPVFTGDPKAPTPTPGDNDTSIATTAFVTTAVATVAGGAPASAEFIVSTANATLTAERVLADSATITWDRTVPGQMKANTSAGGGNVSNSGIPINGQFARWVNATIIEGVDLSGLFAPIASPTFTGDPKAPTPITADNDTSIATTAYVKANLANFQPLDGDLTAIAALTGTNTIYYRSGTDLWSPVTFSGITFSGGVLTVAVGGGNVSNSGTPTVGQVAVWTDATHIQGAAASSLGLAPIASPVFTGDPQAPTPATADNDTSVATTAFVKAQGYAPLASPTFSGNPQAPTPTPGDNDTSVATTAFVTAALAATGGNVSNSGTPANTELAQWIDPTHIRGQSIAALGIATIASPIFTGDPQAPTASPGDSDTSIATTAFVSAAIAAGGGASVFGPPQGRLTLQSANPIMTSNQSAKTQAIYTPYVGDMIPIYNGTSWTMMRFPEISGNSTGAAADKNQDWFVWNNGGTLQLIKGPDWATDTVRANTLVKINGIWLNGGNITSGPLAQRGTYVGTTRTYLDVAVFLQWMPGFGAVGGGPAFLGVYNAYNRVLVGTTVRELAQSWVSPGAWRSFNNSVGNRVSAVFGLAEDAVAIAIQTTINSTSGGFGQLAIGLDTVAAPHADCVCLGAYSQTTWGPAIGRLTIIPPVGFHNFYALELAAAGTITIAGSYQPTLGTQAGMDFTARM